MASSLLLRAGVGVTASAPAAEPAPAPVTEWAPAPPRPVRARRLLVALAVVMPAFVATAAPARGVADDLGEPHPVAECLLESGDCVEVLLEG